MALPLDPERVVAVIGTASRHVNNRPLAVMFVIMTLLFGTALYGVVYLAGRLSDLQEIRLNEAKEAANKAAAELVVKVKIANDARDAELAARGAALAAKDREIETLKRKKK